MDNLLAKITDPMTIMIRLVGLMFLIFIRISRNSVFLFLECPPRILGGFI